MPTLSGPNPMSPGEFQAYGAGTGIPALTQGLGSLAGTLIGDPSRIAQAQYLGSQAGHAQAETAKIRETLARQQRVSAILAQPGAMTDPKAIQAVAAEVAADENLAKALPQAVNTSLAHALALGAPGALQPGQMDALSSRMGVQNYGQTPTGATAALANAFNQTKYTADTTRQTQLDVENMQQAGLSQRAPPVMVQGPNGPVNVAPWDARGQPAYDSSVATTKAGHDATYGPYQDPNDPTRTVTQTAVAAAAQNLQPRPTSSDQFLASVQQNAYTGGDPGQRDLVVSGAVGGKAGTGADAQEGSNIDQVITARIVGDKASGQTGLFHSSIGRSYGVSQDLMGLVRHQTNWLLANGPRGVRGNVNAAVTQAMDNVLTPTGKNGEYDYSNIPGTPNRIKLKEGAHVNWPKGMPIPQAYGGDAPGAAPDSAPTDSGSAPMVLDEMGNPVSVPQAGVRPGPSGVSSAPSTPVPSGSTGSPTGATRPGGQPSLANTVIGRGPTDDIYRVITGIEGPGTSSKGAVEGVMPGTFAQYARPGESMARLSDVAAVRRRILDDYAQKYNGDVPRIATAFFSGPGNVAPPGSPTPWVRNTNDGHWDVATYVNNAQARLNGAVPYRPTLANAVAASGTLQPMGGGVPPETQAAGPPPLPPGLASLAGLFTPPTAAAATPTPTPAPMPAQQIAQPGIPAAPQPAAQQPPGLPENIPPPPPDKIAAAARSPAQAQAEARAKIANSRGTPSEPVVRQAVIALLRMAGVPVPPDILTSR